MPLLYSIAIAAAAKLGYKLAADRNWLPGRLYGQLALDKLKDGDLDGAMRFSDVVLKKNPDDEKAGLVREIIAMRRDARLASMLQRIDNETRALHKLDSEREQNKHLIHRLKRQDRYELIAAWLFFVFTAFAYILVYLFYVHLNNSIVASLIGGGAVVSTIFAVIFLRKLPDRRQQRSLDNMEFVAGERAMSKEIEMRRTKLTELQEQAAAIK